MIDSVGGSAQVNNFLSTMNMKTINDKNLKIMERRAGKFVEEVAEHSMKKAAEGAFEEEMRLVYTIKVKQKPHLIYTVKC